MLTKLRLKNFKNFKDAELTLGPLTLLIGTNASGKSNIRDAFRFLHGIGRGYTLPEIFGEKWSSGEKQWNGIRGGTGEVVYQQDSTFALEVDFDFGATYRIEVRIGSGVDAPRISHESLSYDGRTIFEADASKSNPKQIEAVLPPPVQLIKGEMTSDRPVLPQLSIPPVIPKQMIAGLKKEEREANRLINDTIAALGSMRFHELSPDAMRQPSFPGQTTLTDRGENLSSVLQTICEDPKQKTSLMSWFEELTPMDCKDLDFYQERTGKILVELIEGNGQRTSAYSASDGTLRFLGMLAALLGPEPSRFYFIEELENGIHPARLHLLLELVERNTAQGNIQMVASTHSPYLLGMSWQETLEHASLIYRLPDTSDGRIKRILDIPDAKRLIEEQELINLHASGWFENVMHFLEDMEAPS